MVTRRICPWPNPASGLALLCPTRPFGPGVLRHLVVRSATPPREPVLENILEHRRARRGPARMRLREPSLAFDPRRISFRPLAVVHHLRQALRVGLLVAALLLRSTADEQPGGDEQKPGRRRGTAAAADPPRVRAPSGVQGPTPFGPACRAPPPIQGGWLRPKAETLPAITIAQPRSSSTMSQPRIMAKRPPAIIARLRTRSATTMPTPLRTREGADFTDVCSHRAIATLWEACPLPLRARSLN